MKRGMRKGKTFDCKGGRDSGVALRKNNEKIETTAFSG